MPSALATVAVVGTVLSFVGQQQAADAAEAQGKAQQQAADYQAKSMEVKAGQERAVSQRQAINERRKLELAQSRAQAVAAASGAGAADPTVVSLSGQLEREGELNALTALYHGEQAASGLEEGAGLKRYEGNATAIGAEASADAARVSSYGSLFKGLSDAGSMYMKYGSGVTQDSGSPLSASPSSPTDGSYHEISNPNYQAGYYRI